MLKIQALAKVGLLALVHEAEESIVGEKVGAERKAWVRATVKDLLTKAGVMGVKFFGFSFDQLIMAAVDAAIDWAAAQLKAGFDRLEKL